MRRSLSPNTRRFRWALMNSEGANPEPKEISRLQRRICLEAAPVYLQASGHKGLVQYHFDN